MDCFFDANGIDKDDRKRAILLSLCGSQTYRLLHSLVYKEIVKILNDHFSPEPSITLQRSKFNSKSREKGQSVASFVADLRQISEYCKLEDMLCAMLLLGIAMHIYCWDETFGSSMAGKKTKAGRPARKPAKKLVTKADAEGGAV